MVKILGRRGVMFFKKVITIFGFVAGIWIPAQADWVRLQGPEEGSLWTIAIKPDDSQTLLAGGIGLFRSTNGGASWDIVKDLEGVECGEVGFVPNNSLIAYVAGGREFYKTTNGGGSWQALWLEDEIPNRFSRWSVLVDPQNPNTVYGTGSYDFTGLNNFYPALFKSVNGGTTWGGLTIIPQLGQINALAIDPANSQVLYAGGFINTPNLTGIIYKYKTTHTQPIKASNNHVHRWLQFVY